MKSNWSMVMRSQGSPRVSLIRVVKPTGWGGGYKRKSPKGEHKCLPRSEMALLMARLK